MKNIWKWILGIALVALLALPFAAGFFLPFGGYGMMGYGWHMPMMYGGFGMTPFGGFFGFGMFLSALIQLGVLVLIVLGIVWLIKQLNAPKSN